ncbi:copper resistance CopC family protein [Sinomonas susongensis]|uniref:copper resistance CopC family protein n=1 Tax=Sinomonas susongensis TaxID=1324851 RepID=UPI001109036D|nr:copper resistance CopC family protein [Sinomonas susongensis]
MTSGLRTLARAAAVVGLAVGLALPAAAAQAHDVLEATNPANGSTVASVPDSVVLTYDHTPIAIGTEIQVKDANGTNESDGSATVVDNNVTQAIKPDAPAGKYTVVWRVVSSDSHPIEGTFTFTAKAGGGGSSSAAAQAGGASTPAAAASASPTDSSGGFPVWAIPVAILVLLVIGGLAWFVRRSLSRAAAD